MQHKLLSKASYLRIIRTCCTLSEWYCKTQRIQRFSNPLSWKRVLCNRPHLSVFLSVCPLKFCNLPLSDLIISHHIFDRHTILYSPVHLVLAEVSAPNRSFYKPFKVNQLKRSLTRNFELVVMWRKEFCPNVIQSHNSLWIDAVLPRALLNKFTNRA